MIGVGILGAGYFGAFHARAIAAAKGARLVAVSAEEQSLADAFAGVHGGTPYGDWRAMLDDKAVDAVAITAPHHLHCPFAVAALRAGKHVLLEKPMALSVAECSQIIAAAEESGAKLMIGQIMHFALPCLVAREILDRGDLGRPVTGSSSLLKTWMEVNRRGWHLDPASGGGMLMTAGIHALDRLVWLMDGRVASVSAAAATAFHDQKADDSAMMLLRFADHRFGQVASIGFRDGAGSFDMDLVCETRHSQDRFRSRCRDRPGRQMDRCPELPRPRLDAERHQPRMAGHGLGHRRQCAGCDYRASTAGISLPASKRP